jgi:hypothetical protein
MRYILKEEKSVKIQFLESLLRRTSKAVNWRVISVLKYIFDAILRVSDVSLEKKTISSDLPTNQSAGLEFANMQYLFLLWHYLALVKRNGCIQSVICAI